MASSVDTEHPTDKANAIVAHDSTQKQPEGPQEWKHNAPYRMHESNEHFDAVFDAECHCGRVQYSLSREVPLARSCFQWAAILHKTDINFKHGHHDLVWYDPTEKTTRHKLPCKVSCAYCRTPIMDEGRNMILLFPTLIKFGSKEKRDKWAPTCHMFYGQRVVDVKDGKPKYKGLDSEKEKGEMDKELW
ncbi:hypothetical protein MMC10_007450 [Thelotrema lepadinum]|nr:hypothetical protein [Thelotrema lepadinum]